MSVAMPECGWMPKSGSGLRRDFGVIQEYEGLDQLADIGGADQARDGSVPATAGASTIRASVGAHGRLGCILDVETNGGAGDCCSRGVHFHLHESFDVDKIGAGLSI